METVLKPVTEHKDEYMSKDNIANSRAEDVLSFDKLSFNDQGSASWYKQQFPHFPDEFYQVFELYSRGNIRFKEYRNFLKKLDKKGKLQRPTTDTIFKKTNIDTTEDDKIHVIN